MMLLAVGILVGLVLGLTGAGGSVLAVPLLMASQHWGLKQAAPVALIAVAGSAAYGSWTAWRRSYLRYRAAMLMGAAGLLTAPLGLSLAQHLPMPVLNGLFATVLVIVSLRLLLQALLRPEESPIVRASVSGDGAAAAGQMCGLDPTTGRLVWTPRTLAVIGSIGAVTGLLSGMLGVGGGFVIVPSLRAVSPLSMQSSIATSLMTIAIVASGTLLLVAMRGNAQSWQAAVPFAAAAAGGMFLGRLLAPRIAGARLEVLFALAMLVAAGRLAASLLTPVGASL